jgi:hypothetical protein
MWGKPTIEMGMDETVELSWNDREAGSDIARDSAGLIELVRGYVGGKQVGSESLSYRSGYVDRWFGPADGRRCATSGDLIDAFLRARGNRRGYLRSIEGLSASPLTSSAALLRYRLNVLPNTLLFRKDANKNVAVSHDKIITRRDVVSYQRKLSGIFLES